MPKRKRKPKLKSNSKFRNARRRSNKRKFSGHRRRSPPNVPRPIRIKGKIIPDALFVKLPYTNELILGTNTAGSLAYWTLRGNTPVDPEYSTSLNYSAYGWHYWSQLYKRCVCYAAKIRVTFASASGFSGNNAALENNRVGFLVDTDTTIPSTFLERIIHPRIGKWTNLASTSHGNKNQKTLRDYVTVGRAFGIPKKAPQSSEFYSFPTTGVAYPQKEWFIHLWTKDKSGTGGTHILVDYTITYYCKFYDPHDDAFDPVAAPTEFDDPADYVPNTENPEQVMETRPSPPP